MKGNEPGRQKPSKKKSLAAGEANMGIFWPTSGFEREKFWSNYRKSLPGQFIRIRLKIEQNCCLFLDIFSSAIINDLFMTFTSRLKVDAKCVYQQWNCITVANYFGTPPPPPPHTHTHLFVKLVKQSILYCILNAVLSAVLGLICLCCSW